jgi:hypothetical protein
VVLACRTEAATKNDRGSSDDREAERSAPLTVRRSGDVVFVD